MVFIYAIIYFIIIILVNKVERGDFMEVITNAWSKFLAIWIISIITITIGFMVIAIGSKAKNKIIISVGSALVLFGIVAVVGMTS